MCKDIKVKVDQAPVNSLIRALERAHGDYSLLSQDAKNQALNSAASNPKSGFNVGAVTATTGLTNKTQADIFAGDPSAAKVGRQRLMDLSATLDDFAAAQDKATDVSKWHQWASSMGSSGSAAAADFAKASDALTAGLTSGSISAKQYTAMVQGLNAAQADGFESGQERNALIADASTVLAGASAKSKTYQDAVKALKSELASGGATFSGYTRNLSSTAAQLGLTVSQFDKIPKRIRSKVEVDGPVQDAPQAERLIRDLGKFATLKEIESIVSLKGAALSLQQITNLQKQMHLTPREVKMILQIEGLASANAGVANLRSGLNQLPNFKSVTVQEKFTSVHTDPPHRAGGGPVTAGMPYIVGEHRPELFVPDQNGRIIPSVPSSPRISRSGGSGAQAARAAQPVAAMSLDGVSFTIDNWETGTGHFTDIADSRVNASSTLASRIGRTTYP